MFLKTSISALFVLLASLKTSVLASDYWIEVTAETTGPYTVEATIDSNIPEDVLFAVSMSLADQKPDDIAIGTSFTRLPFSGQRATVVIDGQERVTPAGSQLPTGDYEVKVAFHPRWKENSSTAELLSITESIRASQVISLEASGQSKEAATQKQQGQQWVIMNIYSGVTWNQGDLIQRFGGPEYIENTRLNPSLFKNYYFESIDITFTVNANNREFINWKMGRTSE